MPCSRSAAGRELLRDFYISPALGEHPVYVLRKRIARGFILQIEECADFVTVDLDVHWRLTSCGVRRICWADVGDLKHHVCENTVSSPEGDTDILHAVPLIPVSTLTQRIAIASARPGKTYDQVQHTLENKDGSLLHSANTHWSVFHRQSGSHYHTVLPRCCSKLLDRSYGDRTSLHL